MELITLLASRAISHPLLSMRDKIRSFVLGGLLGWEEEGAEYPPRVPQEEMSGGLGEDSMFDSEIQQESSDAMTNDSLID